MIKERVVQLIEYLRLGKEDFFTKIGMTSANFRGIAKKTPLNSTAIENILSIIPDVNLDWLISGNGEMFKSIQPQPTSILDSKTIAIPSEHGGIPLIPFDAAAGYMSGTGVQVMEYECDHYVVPTFKGAEFLIRINGMSMYPKYASGDIVACMRLPLDTFFQWNKVYVIDSQQGILIKRIKRGSDDYHISLVSENKEFEPFELHRDELNSIALVIGLIRLE